MVYRALRGMLLAGLLVFPAAVSALIGLHGADAVDGAAVIGMRGGAALFHHRPIDCGPGPDC
jgi:hypothetical protein